MTDAIQAALVVFMAGLVAGTALASQDCPGCPQTHPWFNEPPFQSAWEWLNPNTTGLPVGAQAPVIPGVDYGKKPTIVVGSNGRIPSFWIPQLRKWAQMERIQLVVIGCNLKSDEKKAVEELGDVAIVITTPPEALIQCALWKLAHELPPPVTFFISQEGRVLHKLWGFRYVRAFQYDEIVQYFAKHWEPPPAALSYHFFWLGEKVPWPPVPLYTLDGKEVYLGPGIARLIYVGPFTGEKGEMIFAQLERLREQFPKVEFIWWHEQLSPQAILSACEYSYHFGPPQYRQPVGECIQEIRQRAEKELAELRSVAETKGKGWRVLLDQDFRVGLFWGLVVLPAIMIMDAEGTVKLPPTFYPTARIRLAAGEELQWVIHPQTEAELARILAEVSSGR